MRSSYGMSRFFLYAAVVIAVLIWAALEGDNESKVCLGLVIFSVLIAGVAMFVARRAEQRRRKRIKAEQLRAIRGDDEPKEKP